MRLADFDYVLPESLIAQEPAEPRDASRLLVLDRQTGAIDHRAFRDLPDYFKEGDALVLNDTRVIPARLQATKSSGGKVKLLYVRREEVGRNVSCHPEAPRRGAEGSSKLCHCEAREAGRSNLVFSAMIQPSGRVRVGTQLFLGPEQVPAKVIARDNGYWTLKLSETKYAPESIFEKWGSAPLPPYINRAPAPEDLERYQTVYARHAGAIAAPTAGLHFTPEILTNLEGKGIRFARVTLHVGPGTFLPVRSEDIEAHKMESEEFVMSEDAADQISKTRREGGRVTACGTTSLRVLETVGRPDGRVEAQAGRTDLFIYPPFEFKAAQRLLTNFHLPKSTLLMLVSAFAGRELIRKAYEEAIARRYRFYSYGDAMLIL